MSRRWLLFLLALAACPAPVRADQPVVRVGAKEDVEGGILGEIARQLAEAAGARVEAKRLKGKLTWLALTNGDIDLYPEYTGTLTQEILAGRGIKTEQELRQALADMGIRMTRPLGFSNTYAVGMREEVAERLGIRTISDLRKHPDLRLGFSNEFMGRKDGWPGLRTHYALPHKNVRGLDHTLAYQALRADDIQATDLYSTDAEVRVYDLRVLEDDRRYFPDYQALFVYRADLAERAPEVTAALHRLEGQISEREMIAMNAAVRIDRKSDREVAATFLAAPASGGEEGPFRLLLRHTWQHLFLVAVSLLAGILVAVPLGILAARRPRIGQVVLAAIGVIQTIPSLALLMFISTLLAMQVLRAVGASGIGAVPAIVALFLYSLLPIVRNTYTGLHNIPPHVRESAEALGLPPLARLRLVELPMAARTILAGVKTAAVISVGYATLGAFISAGGYGEAILTGMSRGDNAMVIWQGAVPAAVMALAVQGLFEVMERYCVPRGLRLK